MPRRTQGASALLMLALSPGVAQAQSFQTRAEVLVRANPEIVISGYVAEGFVRKEILWQQVLYCRGGNTQSVAARAICVVCSIDSSAGLPYPLTDFRAGMGYNLPSTAVAIYASYAYFLRRPEGWAFERYAPFGANFTSRSREPYHRANLDNLIGDAPAVCADLEEVSGYE